MKKTFTINISGTIFHIDDDAYESLSQYLGKIKAYFDKQEGGAEVCSDIEARIAEILREKITETKQVITIEDILYVISVMGRPGDITGEGSESEKESSRRSSKRLYRDPDNRVLGGVCSGIAAYFNIDPVIIRLIFVVLIFSGVGALLYLIMWIITPEAATVPEKLEMRGEPVTIENIEKSLKKEWTQVREKISDLTTQAKESVQKQKPAFGVAAEQTVRGLGLLLKALGTVVRVVIGILLLMMGIGFSICLLVFIFGWFGPITDDHANIIFSFPVFLKAFLAPGMNPTLFQISGLLLVGIPVVMLFYGGLRMTFAIERIRYFGITAFNIWVVNLICLVYLGLTVFNNYRVPDTYSRKEFTITPKPADTLLVSMNTSMTDSLAGTDDEILLRDSKLVITEKGRVFIRPDIRIVASEDSMISLTSTMFARAGSLEKARKAAMVTGYHVNATDSLICFDPVFALPEGAAWQARKSHLTLKLPVGTIVKFDSSLYRMLEWDENTDWYEARGKVCKMTDKGLVVLP
jgi:phage shock protein PspC (stress-responsive transcriptional regulator)